MAKCKIKFDSFLDLSTGIPLNVVMVMIDSQSHANFQRNLIKTMPVRAFDGKSFSELKEESNNHGTFLKALFDKRRYHSIWQ